MKKGKYVKAPAPADGLMDQALIDIGVKFVELVRNGEAKAVADGEWEPVEESRAGYVKRMMGGAKCVGLCAVLGLVLLWWLKAGFLAPSAAWPAFVAVALVGGVGLGFCLVRR